MNRFTVVWDPDLLADFIREWIAAGSPLRAALTHASNWVDQNLGVEPEKLGRPSAVDPSYRSLLIPETGDYSIVVLYQVLKEDRRVELLTFQHTVSK